MDITEALKITAQWYGLTWQARIRAWGDRSWRSLQQKLVSHAGIRQGSRILDVGTGTGGTAIEAARKAGPAGYVIGIDNASSLLEIAQNEAHDNGLTNVAFAVTDMARLGFADETFEHVISNFAIYGSFPPGVGVQEAYRVLRRGGVITFSMFGNLVKGEPIFQIRDTIFKRYGLVQSSPSLTAVKEALEVVPDGFFPYGPLAEPADPCQVLRFIHGLGFNDIKAVVAYEAKRIPSVESLLTLFAARTLELSAMSSELVTSFERDCTTALQPFFLDQEPVLEIEVMHFSGRK